MNFGNLTQKQNRWLSRSIKVNLEKIHIDVLKENIQLNGLELFKVLVLYYINLPGIKRYEVFDAFMQVFYSG